VNEKLWDKAHAVYFFYDMVEDELIDAHVASGFTPLFAQIPSEKQAKSMLNYLNSHGFCHLTETCFTVPSFDKREPGYSPSGYWRGPVWTNLNWLIFRGLELYGFKDYASYVRSSIIELTKMHGFREYYDPEEGQGYGANNFSWTAALLLDVLYNSNSTL
jgi:neutral trehalase